MNKIQNGSLVIIMKPNNLTNYPGWVEEMDCYDQQKIKVEEIHKKIKIIYHEGYYFNINWLKKVWF